MGFLTLNFNSTAENPEELVPKEEALEEANPLEDKQEFDYKSQEEALNGSSKADHSSKSQQE